MKFSHDRKDYINFQLDALGVGDGGILKTSNGPGGIGVRHPPKAYAIFFCSLVISIV